MTRRQILTTPIADMLSGGPGVYERCSHDDQPADEQSGHLPPAEVALALALVEDELGHPLSDDERHGFLQAIPIPPPRFAHACPLKADAEPPPAQQLADGGTVTLGATTSPGERIRELLLCVVIGAAVLGVTLLLGNLAEYLGQVLG